MTADLATATPGTADLVVAAPDGAASLARLGAVLGAAGIGLQGGGMWAGEANYLVADGPGAVAALTAAGIGVLAVRPALRVPLDADGPGALGRMMRRLAEAGVRVDAQYTDHDGLKVLVVDDPGAAGAALR